MTTPCTPEAFRLVTERCLIAADVDRTILHQSGQQERVDFFKGVGPELMRAAELGTHLAFLTGNSMHELTSRFIKILVQELCHLGGLQNLHRFHFFSNSGGVYIRFTKSDVERFLDGRAGDEEAWCKRFSRMFLTCDSGKWSVQPRYIDAPYLRRCEIAASELDLICHVAREEGESYRRRVTQDYSAYEKIYDLSQLSSAGFLPPEIEARPIRYKDHGVTRQAHVQITIRPILSFRHGWTPADLVRNDLRTDVARRIQGRLDQNGLGHYVARPGGRSSIDITLDKVDKAFALEFLVDRLNIQGTARRGQGRGANAIYLGDEVVAGFGNDYSVTKIAGLLVFAVNHDRDLIPFLSQVVVPSAVLDGPDAVVGVLQTYNRIAQELLQDFDLKQPKANNVTTALDRFKEEWLGTRIRHKVADLPPHLSGSDLQTLYALITLMCRRDPSSREWLRILMDNLDQIMRHLADSTEAQGCLPVPMALGASHPDDACLARSHRIGRRALHPRSDDAVTP